jgi:3-hydroxybutyryl-CoA dehydratase
MSSRYFEDVTIGDRFSAASRTLTEADFLDFARISGDYTPLHIDNEFAKKSIFGERIAHGLLTASATVGLLSGVPLFTTTVIAVTQMTIRFFAPVHAGDTIHAEQVINGKKSLEGRDGGLVTLGVKVINQNGIEVLAMSYDILVRKRDVDKRSSDH